MKSAVRAAVLAAVVAGGMLVVAGPADASLPSKPAQTWGTNGRVSVILPVGDHVYVGGTFTAVVDPSGKTYAASNLAVLSAATGAADLSWQGSANNSVTGLAAIGGKLYVGGTFSKMNGQSRGKLAALDLSTGTLDPNWTPATDAPVDAMGATGSSIYIAGLFTTVTDGSGPHAQAYAAKLNSSTGALDTTWTPAPNGRARALVPSTDGTHIFLGGDFTKVGTASGTNKVASVFATGSGAVDTSFKATPNNKTNFAPVFDLATNGTQLFEAVGGGGGACTAVKTSTGAQDWSKRSNGNLQSVRFSSGTVYCGGHFSGTGSFDGLTRNKLAAVDAATGVTSTTFAPVINSALGVWSLASDASHLYVGGDFTKVSGVPAQHYAEFVDSAAQTVPAAPALFATVGDRVVHLAWTPPASDGGSPIQRYKIYRRTSGGSYGGALATVSSGSTYDDTTVTNGTTYLYVVRAVNAVGEGAASNEVSCTPRVVQAAPPSAPTSFSATAGSGSVQLTWAPPSDPGSAPVTDYAVYRGTTAGGESLLAHLGTAASYADQAVTPGTTYYYRVTATNAAGEGPASTEASATPTAGVPTAPTLAATVSGGVVHLTWTVPSSDGGSPILKYVVARDSIRLVTVKTRAYDDAAVTAGTTHVYQVRAVNAVGAGSYSNKVTVTVS